MTRSDADRQAEELIARRGGGEPLPYHRLMPRIDPEFFRAYEAWLQEGNSPAPPASRGGASAAARTVH